MKYKLMFATNKEQDKRFVISDYFPDMLFFSTRFRPFNKTSIKLHQISNISRISHTFTLVHINLLKKQLDKYMFVIVLIYNVRFFSCQFLTQMIGIAKDVWSLHIHVQWRSKRLQAISYHHKRLVFVGFMFHVLHLALPRFC